MCERNVRLDLLSHDLRVKHMGLMFAAAGLGLVLCSQLHLQLLLDW